MKPEIACSWWTRLHNFGTCLERQLPEAYDQRFNMPCFVPGKVPAQLRSQAALVK